ncbi:MAG: DUF4958 family protein [Bacteroidia bacterium]|nr:DUF4958 family protein [Bacteroidia bacterium]
MRKYSLISLTLLLFAGSAFLSSCNPDEETPVVTVKPSDLSYTPNTVSIKEGSSATSSAPEVQGTAPISFSITTAPDAGGAITVDASTGVITVSETTAAGTYKVSVDASNSAGSTSFTDAFTVEVIAPINFTDDVAPIVSASCSPCHVDGGANTNYGVFANAESNANFIIDRIKRDEGSAGFMPLNGTKLSDADIATIEQWKEDGLKEN